VHEVECVGAGVVGPAAARALALSGREVPVVERAFTIGFETSSRNSEVIHGGIYYPAGSLKAKSCVAGRGRRYDYCRARGVPHARRVDGVPAETIPPSYFCRGVYFTLSARAPFRRLVYPVPVAGGLGVHLTLDLAGQSRFGPDLEWIPAIDYAVDPARADAFHAAIRRYWPALADGALQPGYAGIRPKISGPGVPAADFLVHGPETYGVPGLVNLYGIESPGLTSSLPLADAVVDRLAG
jgi:L-2-hydroxyglutarate oxidase LhgO